MQGLSTSDRASAKSKSRLRTNADSVASRCTVGVFTRSLFMRTGLFQAQRFMVAGESWHSPETRFLLHFSWNFEWD